MHAYHHPHRVQAYGYDGLGILVVRGVPDFAAKRSAGLPYAYRFGNLPEEVKAKYEHPASMYSFGWSHGKEKLEGKPDLAKGSYYANPTYDRPVDDEELIAKYASFVHPNIWPSQDDCPGFEQAFKTLGQLIVDTGALLSAAIDKHVAGRLPGYPAHRLQDTVSKSRVTKARLLFYFPVSAAEAAAEAGPVSADSASTWCGWHNDHGSLTGLTPAMYFDAAGNEIPCPDPRAGLYIRSRAGKTVRVSVPSDCMAFQIGETMQVHSGGVLQATPHCVRAAEVPGVSRGTLAVFMEPEWHETMATPAGSEPEAILRGAKGELLPPGVPPLLSRWTGDAQTFGDFTDLTLKSYY